VLEADLHGPIDGQYFNPLWERIGHDFLEFIRASAGGAKFEESFYVSERAQGGATEETIVQYVREVPDSLYVLRGAAGIGKTTFLRNIFFSSGSRVVARPVIWVDLLKALPESERPNATHILMNRLRSELFQEIERGHGHEGERKSWWTFFIERATDPGGIAMLLRARLPPNGAVSARELDPSLFQTLQSAYNERPLEYIRLIVEYLRSVHGRWPILVIDNCDQLPAAEISKLVSFGRTLAEGAKPPSLMSGDGARGSVPAPRMNAMKVIIALRHRTWRDLDLGTRSHVTGVLRPPDLSQILGRRVARFFELAKLTEIWRSEVRLSNGFRVDLRSFLVEAAKRENLPHTDIDEASVASAVQRFLRSLIDALLVDRAPVGGEPLCERIHRMVNYNTRYALVAVAEYVASGHIEWEPELLQILTQPQSKQSDRWFSRAKTEKALFLGTFAVYTGHSWVKNLFGDGRGPSYERTARPHILLVMAGLARSDEKQPGMDQEGVHVDRLLDFMELSLGYDRSHAESILRSLENDLLVEDVSEESRGNTFRVSDAGEAYLELLNDFEYLQHMAVPVSAERSRRGSLVIASERRWMRVKRVVDLCQDVLHMELEQLSRARTVALDHYLRVLGERSISGRIAQCIWERMPVLQVRGAETGGVWSEIRQEVRNLVQLTSYSEMLATISDDRPMMAAPSTEGL
jgi:hypothetical protein